MAIGDRVLTHADIVAANAAKAPSSTHQSIGIVYNPVAASVPYRERLKALQRRMELDAPPAPQAGSEWQRSDTGDRATIICAAVDIQGPDPRAVVVYRGPDGNNYCVGLDYFHEVIETSPAFSTVPSRIQAIQGIAPVVLGGKRRRFERQR